MNKPIKLIVAALLLSVSILSAEPLSDATKQMDDITAKLKANNRQIIENNEMLDRLFEKLRGMFPERMSINTNQVYTNVFTTNRASTDVITTNWWETNQYTTNINPYWFTNNSWNNWETNTLTNNTVIRFTNWKYKTNHILAMESDGSLTNTIHLLVTSGKFCAVRGHAWGSHLHVTLEYDANKISCRQCQICGLHQSQHATDWK